MKHFISITLLTILVSGCTPGAPTPLQTTPSTLKTPSKQRVIIREREYRQVEHGQTTSVSSEDLPSLEEHIEKAALKKISKIALLAPLSGESKELGKAMLDSAQLAVFDIGSPNLMLLPLDTKGTEEGAVQAMNKAAEEEVDLVLGPLFSDLAKVIAPIAGDNNINVISFSNNQELTNEGVFLLGFMPEQQVERVINYAHNNGIKEFSAIASKNKFGEVTVDELRSTLRKKFKRPKHTEYYTSVDESLSLIIGKFAQPLPEEEKELPEEIPEEQLTDEPAFLKKENEGKLNNQISEFQYEFDLDKEPEKTEAILVPEGGRKAANIAARLFRHGLDSAHIRLLGTGQWDDTSLLKEKKLIGSWFATSSPKLREIFENHFHKTYDYKPVRIASLAYDGVALAAYLSSQNDFSKSAITNRRGFSGVNGVFRIKSSGASERALAIIEITENGFEVIDPAPEDFSLFR